MTYFLRQLRRFYGLSTCAVFLLPLVFENFNRYRTAGESSFSLQTRSTDDFYKIKKIVLDAGHGGHDPGCLGGHSKEKDNALAIVLKLGALIEANFPSVEVIYTRKDDTFIPLIDRSKIANRAGADLFISIHCNSLPAKRSVAGSETYVMGLHTAEHNLEVAKRENDAILLEKDHETTYGDFDPDSPESHILIAAWQSAYLEKSILLADMVEKSFGATGRQSRGVKQAGFMVLKETAMPSVLIETGYLTNASDETVLASEDGQDETAALIFSAFSNYKNAVESSQATPAENRFSPKKQTSTTSVPADKKTPKAAELPEKQTPKAVKTANPTEFKILLTTSAKKLSTQKAPLALITNLEARQLPNGHFQYFANGFSSKKEAEKALPELKNLGFPDARLVEN